ncbi:MAG: glycoside hydrolase family 65 protein [Candidatus Omnitrophica bacterium]|nr:glycoside hydrolase family 65 protein [Candidatus Omnitrophota bacterium]
MKQDEQKIKKDMSWKLVYDRFDPPSESLREALCTLGNGYFSTRGAFSASSASKIHYPGTYMHGLYNRLSTHVAGKTIVNEDLVNCPDWLFLTFKVGEGEWFSLSKSKILSYRQELDMYRGTLKWNIRFKNCEGQKTSLQIQRIVSMDHPHIGAMRYIITPENYSDTVTIRRMLDGRVQNMGVERYRQLNSKHWRFSSSGTFGSNGIFLVMRTTQSHISFAQASKIRMFTYDNKEIRPGIKRLMQGKERIGQEFSIFAAENHSYSIEKTVAIYTSRDMDKRRIKSAAIAAVKKAGRFDELLDAHCNVWEGLWHKTDIDIKGDTCAQKALRFHIFHLLQTASPHTAALDAGLPARGLHGEAYRGHIFWDSLFTMPFYDYHFPEISRGFLKYRYRRLHKARQYALEHGYRGAMFPWQSGSSGREETQIVHLNPMSGEWGPDYSSRQRHVSFAIAYNIYQYWLRTQDDGFLKKYGAEIILSIAQFCASLAKFDPLDKRYHIKGVMGPDEFHEKYPGAKKGGLKDNAYTNVMVVVTLLYAREILESLPQTVQEKLRHKLKIDQKELARWEDVTRRMNIVMNRAHIISQFDGYFSLKELDWSEYRAEYGDIHRLDRILKAEGKSPDAYKLSKQADVLMIFYLLSYHEVQDLFSRLGYRFDTEDICKNYTYYEKRTSHGSTLSKVTHCFLAHLLGKKKEYYQMFLDVLNSDLNDVQGGTTPEGIHCGVMGGSIDLVMRGFAGVWIRQGALTVSPQLPAHWKKVAFRLCYRRRWIHLTVTRDTLRLYLEAGDNEDGVEVVVRDEKYILKPRQEYLIQYKKKRKKK